MMDSSIYQSPASWRYGSDEMRILWSEKHKRQLWRRCWVALAECEEPFGLVTPEQIEELRTHVDDIDLKAAFKLEDEIRHDLMAELQVYASQCPKAAGVIHLGATSMDIKDNAESVQVREAVAILRNRVKALLAPLSQLIRETASLPCLAFTHLQPAEMTTYGYRLSNLGQDLVESYENLRLLEANVRGKGFKGAVGNAAAYVDLVGGNEERFAEFENELSIKLNLPFYRIATQTSSRKQDFDILNQLAALAGIISRFALDIRVMQNPMIGELSEPFGESQVGSSAMPFKRNPISAEKINSLAREVAAYAQIAWQNYSLSILERTLDDSANRRTILPEAFIKCEDIILTMTKMLQGLRINPSAVSRNINRYGQFAGLERLLLVLTQRGADRQKMHEILRRISMTAWAEVELGETNPLFEMIVQREEIKKILDRDQITKAMDVSGYTGIAVKRALECAVMIEKTIE